MSEGVFQPLGDLTEEKLQANLALVGKFIVGASAVDLMTSAILGAVMRMGASGAQELVLHSISLSAKIEILRSIALIQPDSERLKHIVKLMKRVETLYAKRNIVAHGFITKIDGEQVVVSMTLPKLLKQRLGKDVAVKLSDLPKLADEAIALSSELSTLVETIEVSQEVEETAETHKEVLGLRHNHALMGADVDHGHRQAVRDRHRR
jgi:hypothetical protein